MILTILNHFLGSLQTHLKTQYQNCVEKTMKNSSYQIDPKILKSMEFALHEIASNLTCHVSVDRK